MHLPKLPRRVTLELTNRCNRKCAGCPRLQMDYPVGDMSITLLTKVTEQLPESTVVVPFFRGEPTLHNAFTEAMKILSKFDVVQLATNGDYLTETNQKAIRNACTFLSLSLHEFKMPSETRWLGFLYDLGGAGVETQVSILDTLLDKKQRGRWIREWCKHADRVRIYETHSENGFGSMSNKQPTSACHKPFEDMVVYWDGRVGLCNHDWNNPYPLGDLNTKSVSEVWNSVDYRMLRELHKGGFRRAVPTCVDCSFESNKVYGELI